MCEKKCVPIGCIKRKRRIDQLKENQSELSRHAGTTQLYGNVFFPHKKSNSSERTESPTARKSMANQMSIKQPANWL